MDKNWKDKDTIRFLKLYEKEKCLWNYKHENYRNQSARKAAVSKIVKGMNKPRLTDSEVRNKIRNIRSTYAQELAKFIRALKDGRKDYMSSLVWFPMAHNFLRKVVASKSLEENTGGSSIPANETQDAESETNKVKKPIMVVDPPNSAENSENSNDSRKADSPFDSPGSPDDGDAETIETLHVEDSQVDVAPGPFNSQGLLLNAANVKILDPTKSGNSQAEADAVQSLFYLHNILNATNSNIEVSDNVNYQVVDAQNIFYLQDSLNPTGQIVDTQKSCKVQVLQMQTPVTEHNSSNPISNIEIPKSSEVQVLQMQTPISLQNSSDTISNIKVPKSNKMKILQVQRPVFVPTSANTTVTKEVETPNSNNIPVIQAQSPVQNLTKTRRRRKVDTPISDNLQPVDKQNPASTTPKRKRNTKAANTAQVQETTKKEDFVQDEFFYFAQNVASQLRELPLKSALLCQSKILETITKERIAAFEKISTAPTVLPLVAQHSNSFNQTSNINGDQWESDLSDE